MTVSPSGKPPRQAKILAKNLDRRLKEADSEYSCDLETSCSGRGCNSPINLFLANPPGGKKKKRPNRMLEKLLLHWGNLLYEIIQEAQGVQ